MSKRYKFTLSLIFLLITIFFSSYWFYYKLKREPIVHEETIFLLKKNINQKKILRQLFLKNIKISYISWRIVSVISKKKIVLKAGEYLIPKDASIIDIINLFHSGETITRRFTLIEGWTARELKEKLLSINSLSGNVPDLKEGIYKPNTYNYKWGYSRRKLLRHMKLEQEKLINEIWKSFPENFILKSKKELLILASIIQKETSNFTDSQLIASVFLNRLTQKMKLQSDVTLAYGLDINGKKLTKKHIKSFHPFNTYSIYGLPPTPISFPGEHVMYALKNYKKTNYLYFVSNGKGGHRFSSNYNLHKKNIVIWKNSLKKGK